MQKIKKIILSVAATAALSNHTYAASFEFENFTIDWDTVFTAGVQFRIEERDPYISEGSSGVSGDLISLPAIIDNAFIINSNEYGELTVPYGYGRHASKSAFGHGGRECMSAFADPQHDLVVIANFNGMPGEPRHNQRVRDFNTAVYEDLGLNPGA